MTSRVPDASSPQGPNAIVILCAVPSDFDVQRLATDLVERSLAACVQVGASLSSIYRWKGAVEKSSEALLIIKTRRDLFDAVEAAIRAVHPYDVPEIIALPVWGGHRPYLAWIAEATAN